MLLTLVSIIAIDLIGFGVVIPVLPFYAESYGASATVLGLLLTSYAAMQFLCAPAWGKLSDRIGRRPVLLITIAGASVALLILGAAPSLAWLFVARLLGGVFGANISVATAYVTDITTSENRTKGMGLIGAAFGVGFILGPAIGGLLSPYGYPIPMYTAAALAAANLGYAALVLKEPDRHQVQSILPTKRQRILADRYVRQMCLIYFLFTVGVTQLEAIFAFFMMDRFAYDAREVAWILVMMAVIMIGIQGGMIRRLSELFGEKRLLIAGALLLAVSFAAIPCLRAVPLLLIPLAIASVGRGISHPAMLSLVSRGGSEAKRGAVMGTFQASASLARVFGPSAAGLLYDRAMGAPFWLAAAVMILVFGLALKVSAVKHPINNHASH